MAADVAGGEEGDLNNQIKSNENEDQILINQLAKISTNSYANQLPTLSI